MFKHKSTRRQLFAVLMSMAAVFMLAQMASRMFTASPQNWELITFGNMYNPGVTFSVELRDDGIRATHTNSSFDGEIFAASAFTLAFLTYENEWRVMPFHEDTVFSAYSAVLPLGYNASYIITPDLLAVNLRAGYYRILTDIYWQTGTNTETSPIWVEFILEEI